MPGLLRPRALRPGGRRGDPRARCPWRTPTRCSTSCAPAPAPSGSGGRAACRSAERRLPPARGGTAPHGPLRLPARGRLRGACARRSPRWTATRSLYALRALGPARPRRRRLPDGPQGQLHPQGLGAARLRRVQRRRERAGHLQGPRADGDQPLPAAGGDHDRRLRDRRGARLHLHPRRVRAPGARARRGARPGPRGRLPRHGRRRHRRSTSTSRSTAAPAPTSAARRPRCWRASRASAASRG